MTVRTTVTREQAEAALAVVAKLLGPYTGQDDGEPCPTGEQAYLHGTGVTLDMEWDWPSSVTILGEGGDVSDWAYYVCYTAPGLNEELAKLGVWAEPYAGYALCLYATN